MQKWQLQQAKAKLSELVKRAEVEGPQSITVHGKPTAVVLSQAEFERLTAHATHKLEKMSFVDFLLNSPLAGADLDIERDKSPARDVDLEL